MHPNDSLEKKVMEKKKKMSEIKWLVLVLIYWIILIITKIFLAGLSFLFGLLGPVIVNLK